MRFMAIDIGASSGRHILAYLEEGRLKLKEVYRFENRVYKEEDKTVWHLDDLFGHIIKGLKGCPVDYIGIDTWGVDFVLLDKKDQVIGKHVAYRHYRDLKTELNEKLLYEKTGIQKQAFNSIYQLMDRDLEEAETFLMVPDYFNFLLTGVKSNEITNMSTSQLLNNSRVLDDEILEIIRTKRSLFPKMLEPGTILGPIKRELIKEIGYKSQVVITCSHDTASAFLSTPSDKDGLVLSSGTWSLLGAKLDEHVCSEQARESNYTNELGMGHVRFLKNIMGLWIIQCLKKEVGLSFEELCRLAEESTNDSIIDVNNEVFFAPDSMMRVIEKACEISGQELPKSIGDYSRIVYRSLAHSYMKAVHQIEDILGRSFSKIHIVGGGAYADYLNRLTCEFTKKTVIAGPMEATATGNALSQMVGIGVISKEDVKGLIERSFELKEYKYEV